MNRKAYAKINLALNITGIQENGYHTVDMIMQTINLHDDLEISLNNTGRINLAVTCDEAVRGELTEQGTDVDNLAYRAAIAFFKELENKKDGSRFVGKGAGVAGAGVAGVGADIRLHKRIPSGAGLGGGSSDAAEVLKGLNELTGSLLTEEELKDIAAKLGSDVPFFISGGTARCTGTGTDIEKLRPIGDMFYVVIAKPFTGNPTPLIYREYDNAAAGSKAKDFKRPDIDALSSAINGISENKTDRTACKTAAFAGAGSSETSVLTEILLQNNINVLEKADERISYSITKEIKTELLKLGAITSCMSGSGSAVYGLFTDKEKMETAVRGLRESELKDRLKAVIETVTC